MTERRLLTETIDRCPYDFYDEIRNEGVTWDESANAWLAPTFAATKQVYLDEQRFRRSTAVGLSGPEFERVLGTGSLLSKFGEDRTIFRKWWLSLFRPRQIEELRTGLSADVIARAIDTFAYAGKAELVSQYTDPVATCIVAGLLGLPWDDDSWMSDLMAPLNFLEDYRGMVHVTPDASDHAGALDATYRVDEVLRPFVERARKGEVPGVLARIWSDPELVDFSEEERLGVLRTFFLAGRQSTRTSLTNSFWLIFNTPGLADRLRTGSEEELAVFVEESLRIYGTAQFRSRVAAADTELEGTLIREGERVIAMNGSANRDPQQFTCPADIDFDRPNPRQHLAFSVGSGACVGSSLARHELREGVMGLLQAIPDVRLDDSMPAPQPRGFGLKMFAPLHVEFTPATDPR